MDSPPTLTILSLGGGESSLPSWRSWQAGEPSTGCRTAPSSPTRDGSRPSVYEHVEWLGDRLSASPSTSSTTAEASART